VIFLLKEDDCAELTGFYKTNAIEFSYDVIRFWERSPEDILNASPALLPLLPLAQLDLGQMPGYLQQAREIVKDKSDAFQAELWKRMRLFAELRFGAEYAEKLLTP